MIYNEKIIYSQRFWLLGIFCFCVSLGPAISQIKGTWYYELNRYDSLLKEEVLSNATALAREVRWIHINQVITKKGKECKPVVVKDEIMASDSRFTFPEPTLKGDELFTQRGKYYQIKADKEEDPLLRDDYRESAVESYSTAESWAYTRQSFERMGATVNLATTLHNAFVSGISAANIAITQSNINEAINWAQPNSAFINSSAPEGSILYLILYYFVNLRTDGSGLHTLVIQTRLKRNNEIIEGLGNHISFMFYRKSITPNMPPPGYTDQGISPEIITGVGKHPQWGGFALLIRKSANDMHTLVSVLEELE